MKRIHIAISVQDISASVEDYSQRLGCQPCVIIPDEYALWRTDNVNFSIRQTGETRGTLRHLGWEDSTATSFCKDIDVNKIEWEQFNAQAQADEIRHIWPEVNYCPADD